MIDRRVARTQKRKKNGGQVRIKKQRFNPEKKSPKKAQATA